MPIAIGAVLAALGKAAAAKAAAASAAAAAAGGAAAAKTGALGGATAAGTTAAIPAVPAAVSNVLATAQPLVATVSPTANVLGSAATLAKAAPALASAIKTGATPTLLSTLAEAGKAAVPGAVVGGIRGAVQDREKPGHGALRGAALGAGAGAIGGGVSAALNPGTGAVDRIQSALAEMVPQAPTLEAPSLGARLGDFGKTVLRRSQDMLIGDRPFETFLGVAPAGTERGILPSMAGSMALRIGAPRRKIVIQPFGRRGVAGQAQRMVQRPRRIRRRAAMPGLDPALARLLMR